MMWDGEFDFTLDDRSLLRAILITEGADEGWPCYQGDFPGYGTSIIRSHVIEKQGFKIVRENEHLRTLLRAFLEENIRVADKRAELQRECERGIVTRLFRASRRRSLQAELTALEAPRDAAFKKYEMLRRLTDWENVLLQRLLA